MRCVIGLTLLGFATAGSTETDIWGHLAIGLDMLRTRQFMWVDPYSFTSDLQWVNHEWLWDLVSASVYRGAGLPGLLALRAVLIAGVLWLVDRASSAAPSTVRTLTLGIVTIACLAQWQSTRPQIATLTLYALTLTHLSAWWLPLLFALWANVHGGWLIGLGAVVAYAAAQRTRRSILIAGGCLVATLVNPYGVRLWIALSDAILRGWSDVAEWAPIWSRVAGLESLFLWVPLVVGVLWLWTRVTHDRFAWGWTLLTWAAAAQSRRLIGLAAVTSAILLVRLWRNGAPAVDVQWTTVTRSIFAGATVLGLALGFQFVAPTASCFPSIHPWIAPEADAVAFMRSTDARRAVVYFDFGEYAIWHLRDQLRVSMDNRRETVYSERAVQAQRAFARGLDPDYPTRIGADAIWWPRAEAPAFPAGWFTRLEGPRTVIALRTNGPITRGGDLSERPCFPHP